MFGVWRVWLLINTLQTPLFACDKHISVVQKEDNPARSWYIIKKQKFLNDKVQK